MAAGHLVMGFDPGVIGWFMGMDEAAITGAEGLHLTSEMAFFTALALLIVGNGFFKPNISTIVGSHVRPGRPPSRRRVHHLLHGHQPRRRHAAPAALRPTSARPIGWHFGFGLATIGMLVGLAVFVAAHPRGPACSSLGGALSDGVLAMVGHAGQHDAAPVSTASWPCALAVAGVIAFMPRIGPGRPARLEAGAPPEPRAAQEARGRRACPSSTHVYLCRCPGDRCPCSPLLVWSNLGHQDRRPEAVARSPWPRPVGTVAAARRHAPGRDQHAPRACCCSSPAAARSPT